MRVCGLLVGWICSLVFCMIYGFMVGFLFGWACCVCLWLIARLYLICFRLGGALFGVLLLVLVSVFVAFGCDFCFGLAWFSAMISVCGHVACVACMHGVPCCRCFVYC